MASVLTRQCPQEAQHLNDRTVTPRPRNPLVPFGPAIELGASQQYGSTEDGHRLPPLLAAAANLQSFATCSHTAVSKQVAGQVKW